MDAEPRRVRRKKRRKFAEDPTHTISSAVYRYRSSHLSNSLALFIVILTQILSLVCLSHGSCQTDQCIGKFRDNLAQVGPEYEDLDLPAAVDKLREIPRPTQELSEFCRLLLRCSSCLEATSRACRADLNYHYIAKVMTEWSKDLNCEKAVKWSSLDFESPSASSSRTQATLKCTYAPPDLIGGPLDSNSGQGDFGDEEDGGETDYDLVHCALYGDPHLMSYEGTTETCQIEGAWPLVDNEFLAVQVTNVGVCVKGVESCRATATSKVTVVVKDAGMCSPQLTYEATAQTLPKAFNDGTVFAGVEKATVIEEKHEGREIEIWLRHAGSSVVIRRIGGTGQFPSLSVSVRTPQPLVPPPGSPSSFELCAAGCPSRQSLSLSSHHPHPFSHIHSPSGFVDEAVRACLRRNLTDAFLDACVFDLVTTGDLGFAEAAQLAQLDLWAMNPRVARSILTNRTSPNNDLLTAAYSKSSVLPGCSLSVFFTATLVFLLNSWG